MVVDVAGFEQAMTDGTVAGLEQGAAAYAGNLLAGLDAGDAPFTEWLLTERERLREMALEGLGRLLGHHRARGATEDALVTAVRLLEIDPLQEAVQRLVMSLYAETGRRGAALRQYQGCVAVLERELGAEPEEATRALYREILSQSPASVADPSGPGGRSVRAGPAHHAGPRNASVAASRVGSGGVPLAEPVPSPVGRPAWSGELPLIGREAEMLALAEAWQAARAGRGQVVALTGEAGVGKSRLALEVARAAGDGGRVAIGRCYETERVLPFAPWVHALRAGELATGFGTLDGLAPVWRAELARLVPEAAGSGGVPAAGPAEPQRVFEAVAQLLAATAGRRPLLILLEDLHWADDVSLRLLAFVGRRLGARPVLVAVTAREEEIDEAPTLGRTLDELEREGRLRRLPVSPLSRPATSDLVRLLARAGTRSEEAARLDGEVWRASEGNAFVAMEVMHALQQAGPDGPRPLPRRVRDLTAQRLERLGEPARRLGELAAVIGRQCEFALLQRSAGLSEPAAAEAVEELVRRRVLHESAGGFEFVHDRIREAARDRILPGLRPALHRQVAAAMEALYGGDLERHALALGTHYYEGAVWDRAAAVLRQAALAATVKGAPREGEVSAEQAIAARSRLPASREGLVEDYDLRVIFAYALFQAGQFDRAVAAGEEAARLAREMDDPRRLALALMGMAVYRLLQGRYADCGALAQQGLAIGEQVEDLHLQIWGRLTAGMARFEVGDYPHALVQLRWVVRIAAESGDAVDRPLRGEGIRPSLTARAFLTLAGSRMGDFREALALGGEAVAIADAGSRPFERIWTRCCLGHAWLMRGDADHAIAIIEPALALCEGGAFPVYAARAFATLGAAHALAGRPGQATPLLAEAIAIADRVRITGAHSAFLLLATEGQLLAGQIDEAGRTVATALDGARARGERGNEALALQLHGEVAARAWRSGERPGSQIVDRALGWFASALALADELGMRPLAARCRLGRGATLAAAGRQAEARAEIEAARDDFSAMDMAFWQERAEELLAQD